jgi:hypothetical protein
MIMVMFCSVFLGHHRPYYGPTDRLSLPWGRALRGGAVALSVVTDYKRTPACRATDQEYRIVWRACIGNAKRNGTQVPVELETR